MTNISYHYAVMYSERDVNANLSIVLLISIDINLLLYYIIDTFIKRITNGILLYQF